MLLILIVSELKYLNKLKHLLVVLRPPLRITTNVFGVQAFDSIMCAYFCIGFIDFMLAGKTLTKYTNLFSPNNFKKNDDIILNYFMSNI